MARHNRSGRTTEPPRPVTRPGNEIPPLRKRRPAVFWFIIVATAAMVLTTFASFVQALS